MDLPFRKPKGGPKLLPPELDNPAPEEGRNSANTKPTRDKDGYPVLVPGATQIAVVSYHARWHGNNESMYEIARTLGFQTGAPVQDDTGLTGKYDFTISWIAQRPGWAPAENDEAGPSLLSAVHEQLGLKLTAKKGPIEIIVADHAEKMPLEN